MYIDSSDCDVKEYIEGFNITVDMSLIVKHFQDENIIQSHRYVQQKKFLQGSFFDPNKTLIDSLKISVFEGKSESHSELTFSNKI